VETPNFVFKDSAEWAVWQKGSGWTLGKWMGRIIYQILILWGKTKGKYIQRMVWSL